MTVLRLVVMAPALLMTLAITVAAVMVGAHTIHAKLGRWRRRQAS